MPAEPQRMVFAELQGGSATQRSSTQNPDCPGLNLDPLFVKLCSWVFTYFECCCFICKLELLVPTAFKRFKWGKIVDIFNNPLTLVINFKVLTYKVETASYLPQYPLSPSSIVTELLLWDWVQSPRKRLYLSVSFAVLCGWPLRQQTDYIICRVLVQT